MVHIPHTHRHHEKIPGRNPKRRKNMLSLFAALVQRNQFGTTQRYKLLHGTFKAAVSDVSEHFHMHLRGGLNLYTSGQKYLSLQWQLWGYKLVYPPTKHQKSIPSRLVFRIYKKQHYHLSSAIGKLIAGDFLFVMQPCEYFETPKGETKQTHIPRKGDIRFYGK